MKSGLRILIRAPQVPFLVPPKTPILGVFGYFGGTENGTWGTSKTKTVLKSVNKTEQLVGMFKSKREKIQIKNHPTLPVEDPIPFSTSVEKRKVSCEVFG